MALSVLSGRACGQIDEPEEATDVLPGAVQRHVITDKQFGQLVLGARQRVVIEEGKRLVIAESGRDADKRIMAILDNEIRAIDQHCQLTEAQKKRLQLAGRGDIARWQNRITELRHKYVGKEIDQQQHAEVMRELQSFRQLPQTGPFGEFSLLLKNLRNTLTDEQRERYQTLVRERAAQAVENALRQFDANSASTLQGENRKKFIDTLIEHGRFSETQSPYMQYIVWFEAGRIQDRLKPLLSERQLAAFQQQVTNAKRVEQTLRQSGAWPLAQLADDEAEDAGKD
jgi:hypothetical protein